MKNQKAIRTPRFAENLFQSHSMARSLILSSNTVQRRLFFRSELCTDFFSAWAPAGSICESGILSAMTHPTLVLPFEIILLCLDCDPIIRNENPFEKGVSLVKKIPSPAKREGIRILLYKHDLFGHLKKHSSQ